MSSAIFSLRSYMATSALPRISLASSIQTWPPSHDCVVVRETSGHTIEISPCHSYTSSELDAFGIPLRFRYEEPFSSRDPDYNFIVTNNATVVGDTGVIVNGDGNLVLESLFPHDRTQPFQRVQLLPAFNTCDGSETFEEDVFLLYGGGGFKNFWHFHVDMLPTIIFLKEAGLFDKVKFAVPAMSGWHREAFARMGVSPDRIIELENKYNKFRRCYLFSTIHQPTLTIPNVIARETFETLRKAETRNGKPQPLLAHGRLVYVARTDSTARLMVNEDHLISEMRNLGFEIAVMSDLSYSEQVALFASSSVVVGAHGAGLTNMLVADRNALLVEILPFGILRAPHYHFLTKSLGIKYEMFVSKIKPSVSPHEYWTLEVEEFLFKLVCILSDYNIGDRDDLIDKIGRRVSPAYFSGSLDVMFSSDEASQCLKRFGFSGLEDWGCWVTSKKAAIRFDYALPESFKITLEVEAFEPALSCPISIICGTDRYLLEKKVDVIEAYFSNPQRSKTLWIEAPGAVSPATASGQPFGDGRSLSLAIKRICIVENR